MWGQAGSSENWCPTSVSTRWRSSAASASTACWLDAVRRTRRSTVDPSLRSQLRDSLRARCDNEGWRALIAQPGTPLMVLDPYRVVEQCRAMKSHFRGFSLHYAVKTLPHPAVLRGGAGRGCGFDVATRAEVDLLVELGLPIDRCINTNPIKKLTDIDHAYMAGVRTFVVARPLTR